MQVVGCQLDIVWEDKAANHNRVLALVEGASLAPGTLLVLPELFATGFSMNMATVAEDRAGPTHRFLGELAGRFQVFVIGGVATRGDDGRIRNDAVVVDPTGSPIARYSKMRPFTLGGESRHYVAGDSEVLFDWQGFKVAPFVCYDLRFPEVFRPAVRRGAEVLVVIANWPQDRDEHWVALVRARAIENQAYAIGVNRTGSDPSLTYRGRSLIVDPHGETIAYAGEAEGLLSAELDRDMLVEYRRRLPFLADMRE